MLVSGNMSLEYGTTAVAQLHSVSRWARACLSIQRIWPNTAKYDHDGCKASQRVYVSDKKPPQHLRVKQFYHNFHEEDFVSPAAPGVALPAFSSANF